MSTATKPRRTLTPEAREEAQIMFSQGMTYTAIAKELEVHSSTVWAALNKDRMKQRKIKREANQLEENMRPRKTGVTFPWEGVTDEEYLT